MISGISQRWMRAPLLAVAFSMAASAMPAAAQDALSEARLRKLEAEIRALQRKVFPGDDKMFTPQITPGSTAAPAPGTPATSAVSDMLRRLDTIEAQLAGLTGQIEQNTNRIAQIEARMTPSAAPLPDAAAAMPVAPTSAAASTPAASTPAPTVTQSNIAAMTGGASTPPRAAVTPPRPAPAPVAATPSAQRLAAVQAIVKPQTADAGDDEYSYGYRLWDAKFYPEAQQQLAMFLQKYPRHKRASWGRNLLGRAYLDAGNPNDAAKWFLQNYQADKQGDRAPDSLLYLAISMKQLKDSKRACIALAEFSETYAAEAAGRLRGDYASARNGLTCG